MSLGEKIQNLRFQKGKSQNDLAEVFHVTYQTISKWENNINSPDLLTIKEIANYFEVSIDYLLDNNRIQKIKIEPSINDESTFVVWTDFKVKNTIAPVSLNDLHRHRTSAKTKYMAVDKVCKGYSVDDNKNIIVIDKDGKIVYFTSSCFGFIGLERILGYQDINKSAKKECFIIEDNYNGINYKDKHDLSYLNCEFVIPKDGFVIIIDNNSSYSERIFEFILTRYQFREFKRCCLYGGFDRFFSKVLLFGDLDKITFKFEEDKIVIENIKAPQITSLDSSIKLYIDECIDDAIAQYESRISDFVEQISDLEARIDNL